MWTDVKFAQAYVELMLAHAQEPHIRAIEDDYGCTINQYCVLSVYQALPNYDNIQE
jgi:hypothetical protein